MKLSIRKNNHGKSSAHTAIFHQEDTKKLLADHSPFAVTESYRSARTNLQFLPKINSCQKYVFTSPYPDAGKSLNTANLAISLAMGGHRVLLLDCDLRRGLLHHLFDIPQSPGLTELLAGLGTQGLTHRHPQYKTLFILPCGTLPPNPAELLSSSQMTTFLKSMEEQFDYILLDTPPINLVTDAAVLSNKTDGYIIIVPAGKVKKEDIDHALLSLEQVDANILGFLLNDVDLKGGSYGKYGRYHTYGSYNSDGK